MAVTSRTWVRCRRPIPLPARRRWLGLVCPLAGLWLLLVVTTASVAAQQPAPRRIEDFDYCCGYAQGPPPINPGVLGMVRVAGVATVAALVVFITTSLHSERKRRRAMAPFLVDDDDSWRRGEPVDAPRT